MKFHFYGRTTITFSKTIIVDFSIKAFFTVIIPIFTYFVDYTCENMIIASLCFAFCAFV